jgi:dihydroxyacetone kinase-like predicted kinase
MRELFELDRSAVVLDSGDALNPSAGEIVEALSSVSVDEVVILTGSPNVELAARAAAEKSDRTVEVLVTDTVQEGLLLLMHHDRSLSAEENLAAMSTAREDVLTAGLAVAARDDAEGRFSIGDSIGYVDGELVAWGAPEDVLADVLSRLPESSAPVVIESSMAPVPVLPSLEAHQGLEAFEHHLAEHPGWWCLIATD